MNFDLLSSYKVGRSAVSLQVAMHATHEAYTYFAG